MATIAREPKSNLARRACRARRMALSCGLWLTAMCAAASAAAEQPPPAAQVRETLAPKPRSDLDIPYPEGASGDATIVLTLTVEKDGSVSAVTPEPALEPFASAAANAARAWQFEPATRAGTAVRARIRMRVEFHPPAPPEPPEEKPPDAASVPAETRTAVPKARAARPIEIQVLGVKMDPSRTATLSRAEVRQIPGTFGDPFRAIEIMPGVTPIISGLPFFFIRGAPPGDAGYFLDGIRVPLLFHIGVGPAVVHPALIERVDLYPGGYPASFGRFSGGIVSGETTPPAAELHGEYNVRLYDAGALVETPFADHRGELLLAGRYSYTAALLSVLNSTTELNYWDYQARVSYALSTKDTVSLFSFGSYDYEGERTPTRTLTLFGTEFHRLDLRYDHALSKDGQLRLAVTGGVDLSRLPDDRYVRNRSLGTRSAISLRLSPGA